jgi:LPS sulfotransferase NodH
MSYNKFVIISQPRSGTHMLRSALEMHTEVMTYGEVFGHQLGPDSTVDGVLGKIWADDVVTKNLGIRAVGFCIHTHHGRKVGEDDVWRRISADPSIRLIFLHRVNTIRRYLSLRRAQLTGQYLHKPKDNTEEQALQKRYRQRVRIDLYDFLYSSAAFDAGWTYMEKKHFGVGVKQKQRCCVVAYEHLLRNWKKESARLQTFLELRWEDLKPTTYRQAEAGEDLSDAIVNFDEFKHWIMGTDHERWLYES